MDADNKIEDLLNKYKYPLALGVVGLVLLIGGALSSGIFKVFTSKETKSAVSGVSAVKPSSLVVDVSGAVQNPGVYKLQSGSRLEEAVKAAGGITSEADPEYLSKNINLAQKVTDGMKIYIPRFNENTVVPLTADEAGKSATPGVGISGLVNINTASETELDRLPGVGLATAQSIIEKRPYLEIEELYSKKAVNRATYLKIKEKVSVY